MLKLNLFKKACIFALLSTVCIIFNNSNAITLQDLSKDLKAQKMLRANFRQERVIKGFKKPLISQGTLVTDASKGIIWTQTSPMHLHYIITDEKIVTFINKDEINTLKATDNPQMFYFSSLLKSIINADDKVLYENFNVTFNQDKNSWTLNLEPKVAPLDKIFSKFELQGDKYVRSIFLYDKESDITKIYFLDSTDKDIVLNDNEISLFAL